MRGRALAAIAAIVAIGSTLAVSGAPAQGVVGTSLQALGAPFASATYERLFGGGTSEQFSSAALGDVTGDGQLDIVVGGMDGYLRVWDASGRLTAQVDTGVGAIQSSPALADVDRDGVLDATVGNTAGVLAAYSFKGSPRAVFWRSLSGANGQGLRGVFGTPAVVDLDGDGYPEIAASSWDHYLYLFSTAGGVAGTLLWQQPLSDTSWSSPAIGDVNADGNADIVVGGDCDGVQGQPCAPNRGGFIWAFDRAGGVLWRTFYGSQVIWSSPTLVDLNRDGALDVVVGTGLNFPAPAGSALLALNGRDGQFLWVAPTPGRIMGSAAVADTDGDGAPELFALSEGGALSAFRSNGSLAWRRCVDDAGTCPPGLPTHGQPVLGDVDGDGRVEAVVMAEHWMRVLDASTGATEAQAVAPGPDPGRVFAPSSAAALAAVGSDTWIVQSVIKDNGDGGRGPGDSLGVLVWKTGAKTGAMPWPVFKGTPDRVGSTVAPPKVDPAAFRMYVKALYLDLLGRVADQAGLDYWAGLLASGRMSQGQLAFTMAQSDEWLATVVGKFYIDSLGRGPDASGLAYWTRQLRAGLPVAEVASLFYASDEYLIRSGGTLEGWVSDLYAKLLLRGADPAGLDYWAATARTSGRLVVARSFYQSAESVGQRIDSLYRALLGRGPDASGLAYWRSVVVARGDLALAGFLAGSQEYWNRAQTR